MNSIPHIISRSAVYKSSRGAWVTLCQPRTSQGSLLCTLHLWRWDGAASGGEVMWDAVRVVPPASGRGLQVSAFFFPPSPSRTNPPPRFLQGNSGKEPQAPSPCPAAGGTPLTASHTSSHAQVFGLPLSSQHEPSLTVVHSAPLQDDLSQYPADSDRQQARCVACELVHCTNRHRHGSTRFCTRACIHTHVHTHTHV